MKLRTLLRKHYRTMRDIGNTRCRALVLTFNFWRAIRK
jgi:hypothetical protein